jgi:hypothetical protein
MSLFYATVTGTVIYFLNQRKNELCFIKGCAGLRIRRSVRRWTGRGGIFSCFTVTVTVTVTVIFFLIRGNMYGCFIKMCAGTTKG